MTNVSDAAKHSAAHVLAAAIKRNFPTAKFGIGPVTKEGFYYDVDIDKPLTDKEINAIEIQANEIIKENLSFQQINMDKESAINFLLQSGQIYKAELVQNIPDNEISFYKLGDEFTDLCRGPHLKQTANLGVIAITNIQKTHWREDSSRPQMQRVTGMLFRSIQELQAYKEKLSKIKQKDFLKEAEKQDILWESNSSLYFSSKGSNIVTTLNELIVRNFNIHNNVEILLPLGDSNIEYRNILFNRLKEKNQSYKIFPQYYQFRSVSQTKIKTKKYLSTSLTTISLLTQAEGMSTFGIQTEALLNIFRKKIGIDISADILCDNLDDTRVKVFSNILKSNVISHNQILSKTNKVVEMQLYVIDSFDRRWDVCSMRVYSENTANYVNEENERQNLIITEVQIIPAQIIAFFLEDSSFELPTILKPNLISIIPIKLNQIEYSLKLSKNLKDLGYYCSVDTRSISMQNKVKTAEESHTPIILVIGNKEVSNNAVSVRHDGKEVGLMDLDALRAFLKENLAL